MFLEKLILQLLVTPSGMYGIMYIYINSIIHNVTQSILICSNFFKKPALTNFMAYGTQRFNTAFTRALQ